MIVLPDFVAPDQAICEVKYGMLQKWVCPLGDHRVDQ